MKTLYFEDYTDFACDIADKYDEVKGSDDLDSVDVVAKYYEAKEIVTELVAMGYGIAFMTDFAEPEWDCYEDEFVISLYDDEIWCEPAKRNGQYIHPEAKVVYLLDNCNSKIIPMIEADETYEVEVGEDACDGDCEDCECNKPPTTSTTIYKINDKEVSKSEYEKAVDKFHDKYMDGIASMLLGYSEFLDEMNEWRKLLEW